MATTTIVTWNVQGSHRLDGAGVAGVIRGATPDVVVLQEVQRRQARDLAAALGMHCRWAFKHWPLVTRPEGAAVLSPHPVGGVERLVLRRAGWWSWRRRIALVATVTTPGGPITVVDTHLSPGSEAGPAGRRRREATVLIGATPGAVIAGDLNEEPGGAALAALVAAGWVDAWAAAHPAGAAAGATAGVEAGEASEVSEVSEVGDAPETPGAGGTGGATNWTPGPRLGRPPTQRLDYVLAPAGWRVEVCRVLAAPDELDWFAARSDHLPLLARLVAP